MAARQTVDERGRSDAPREAVWRLVADADTWSQWGWWTSSGLEREGSPPPGGVHAIKRLARGPQVTVEEVTVFEPPSRLAYELRSGMPLRGYRGEITLSDAPGGGTEIHWRASFEPLVPGTGGAFRRFMSRFFADAIERLGRAAETA